MAVIAIVGAGAIGTMLAGRLASAGHEVRLVGRHGPTGDVTVTVQTAGGTVMAHARMFGDIAQALDAPPPPDLVVVAVKGYDTASVVREMQRAESARHLILTVQNGVGNEEIIATVFGEGRVVSGALTMPVEVTGGLEVRVLKEGLLGLAPVAPDAGISHVAEMFVLSGFRVRTFDDYRRLKWTKLLMNMVGNALPAVLGWLPTQTFSDRRLALLEARAWREAMRVMDALGVRPVSFGGYPFPIVRPLVERAPAALTAQVLRRFVVGGRGGKKPSLLLDMERGKDRSEVMFLNGAVSSHGKQAGVPTPVNTCLTGIVMSVVRGKVPWDEFRGKPDSVLAKCKE